MDALHLPCGRTVQYRLVRPRSHQGHHRAPGAGQFQYRPYVVSWDLVEPEEGKFDFSMIDYQIEAARANNVRLVLLWMASWKNGLSHFPPLWVKANQDRFPRVVNAQGKTLEILSTLSENSRNADATAFAAVMRHIREVDKTHTVMPSGRK